MTRLEISIVRAEMTKHGIKQNVAKGVSLPNDDFK
jgi:hypothetical protein